MASVSESPSSSPSTSPSASSSAPTSEPTSIPSSEPTSEPTSAPSLDPTPFPTPNPTLEPTLQPTSEPSFRPTLVPTLNPTFRPSSLVPSIGPHTPSASAQSNEIIPAAVAWLSVLTLGFVLLLCFVYRRTRKPAPAEPLSAPDRPVHPSISLMYTRPFARRNEMMDEFGDEILADSMHPDVMNIARYNAPDEIKSAKIAKRSVVKELSKV